MTHKGSAQRHLALRVPRRKEKERSWKVRGLDDAEKEANDDEVRVRVCSCCRGRHGSPEGHEARQKDRGARAGEDQVSRQLTEDVTDE